MAFPQKKKPGVDVMIAVGRPKGAPMPPKGMKGAPGGDEPEEMPEDPNEDESGEMPTLYPETVGYHDDARSCGNCGFYAGEQCQLLKMPVAAEGACCAWQGGESEGQDEGSGEGQEMDAGSGNGMMA
jgi:hypothetical protein